MSAIAVSPRITSAGVSRRPAARPSRAARPDGPERPERRSTPGAAAAGTGEAPLHLTVRGRVVVVLLALAVLAGGLLGGRAVADGPERAVEVETYAVQSGDTLWQIAASVAGAGEDVRDVVLDLQRLNGLGDGAITAGQVLLLPAGS